MYVHGDVEFIIPQCRRFDDINCHIISHIKLFDAISLEEPRKVVNCRKDNNEHNVESCTTVGAQRTRPQRMAHGDKTFKRDRQRQIDGNGLRDHCERVDHRSQLREQVIGIGGEEPGSGVDRGQTKQQYTSDDEHGITSGKAHQQVIDARPHLRPRENNH